jgi:hypothetical protein
VVDESGERADVPSYELRLGYASHGSPSRDGSRSVVQIVGGMSYWRPAYPQPRIASPAARGGAASGIS